MILCYIKLYSIFIEFILTANFFLKTTIAFLINNKHYYKDRQSKRNIFENNSELKNTTVIPTVTFILALTISYRRRTLNDTLCARRTVIRPKRRIIF